MMVRVVFEGRISNLHAADLAGEFNAPGEFLSDVTFKGAMTFPGATKEAALAMVEEMDGTRYPNAERGRGVFHLVRIVSVEDDEGTALLRL